MLTIKAPLEITAKTSYIRDPESFYHRIIGNYSLMETHVNEEDLLHITNTPPEIYVTEGEGISSVLNQSVRNENNYNKVEILNNVLNRIVASADVKLTFQDRVFITDSLYRLGIRDDRRFMNAFYRMAQETRNVNALVNLYIEQGQDLRSMVEAVSRYTEKEKKTEKEVVREENRNFLFNNILNRLSTGAVYQIVSNFNRTEDYNQINKNEYSIADQTYAAQNMYLSMMRDNASISENNLFLLTDNTYEEEIESLNTDVTNVQNSMSSAVLMRLLQNIYRTGFDKFFFDQNTYFKFEDTFYQAGDQIVSRIISNFGGAQIRNEIAKQVTNISNNQLRNELALFEYARLEGLTSVDIDNIDEILQQVTVNNNRTDRLFEEYNSGSFSYRTEILPTEKKLLSKQQLEVLKILGEVSSTETIRDISRKIIEASKASGNIYSLLSQYVSQIENSTDNNDYIQRMISVNNLLTSSETEEENESEDTQRAASVYLRNVLEEGIEFKEILNEYVNLFVEKESRPITVDSIPEGHEASELLHILEKQELSEFSFENLEVIKNYIRGSKQLKSKEKTKYIETITNRQLETLEKLAATGKAEKAKKEELIKLLSESKKLKVSEKTIERIKELAGELKKSPEKLRIFFEEGLKETGEKEAAEPVSETGGKKAKAQPAELIFERTIEETGEQEGPQLILNRKMLYNLINESFETSVTSSEEKETIRDYLREIQTRGSKTESGRSLGAEGYEIYRESPQQLQESMEGEKEAPLETELIHEINTENITDADIRRITETVNRMDSLNEQRRIKYLEAIKTIRSEMKEKDVATPLEKTRQLAVLSLHSPEKLLETLSTEKEVRETKEKEVLSRIKDLFPEQSFEIYQLLNRYQTNPEMFFEDNIIRSAEVGELIYDIKTVERAEQDRAIERKKEAEEAAAVQPPIPKVPWAQALMEQEDRRTPVETVHRYQESLTSEEINEQLQMMQHNISKQIKEDVTSEVITTNSHTSNTQFVSNDNVVSQINEVSLQRMIDSKIQQEMSTISTQVMGRIERQMRNEKIRRGY